MQLHRILSHLFEMHEIQVLFTFSVRFVCDIYIVLYWVVYYECIPCATLSNVDVVFVWSIPNNIGFAS